MILFFQCIIMHSHHYLCSIQTVLNLAKAILPSLLAKASLLAQMVKNLPAVQKTWVWSLGWEDLLEKGMAAHSSILAWRTPWTEEPGRLQPIGSQKVGHDGVTNTYFPPSCLLSIYIPQNTVRGFPFSTPSLAFIFSRLWDDGHSYWWEVLPYLICFCLIMGQS